jgi:SNF2 family DNA or RNA helicase
MVHVFSFQPGIGHLEGLLSLKFASEVLMTVEYCHIDGSTPHEERTVAMNEYNKPGSESLIFLFTTRAGGLGRNCGLVRQ